MGILDGKVAIVTGAARGQGEAEARLFVAEGARVMLTDVLPEGAAVAGALGDLAAFSSHDVGSSADWARVVDATTKRFGRLDILVNNAGESTSAVLSWGCARRRLRCAPRAADSIHPGVIETPMLQHNPAALNAAMVRATPMGRIGQPEDIARMVLYLASDAASFITGAEISVDGGGAV
jgi:NAD(P)-dependent dehydrogenase (short-subunit alcohol dehydrogenase family)